MANKLELTWYGKEDNIKIEPRLLIEDKFLSNCINNEFNNEWFKRIKTEIVRVE